MEGIFINTHRNNSGFVAGTAFEQIIEGRDIGFVGALEEGQPVRNELEGVVPFATEKQVFGLTVGAASEAAEKPPDNDFILRAPAAEIDDIAHRIGLQILDEVDSSPISSARDRW